MTRPGWAQSLEWLTTSTPGFVGYWLILMTIAAVELIFPGVAQRTVSRARIKTNLILGLIMAAIYSLPMLSEFAFASRVNARGWGLLNLLGLALWLEVGASFVLYDLLAYAVHRASHVWPPLWRLHRVHHADADIDLSTFFRVHPVAIPVNLGLHLVALVALGLHPLGILLHAAVNLVTMGLGHAHVRAFPRLSRFCALLVVTPEFHRRHHSAWQPETDSNYGEVLTIWDRLLGSMATSNGQVVRIGLGDDYDHDAASLLGQLKLPFIRR